MIVAVDLGDHEALHDNLIKDDEFELIFVPLQPVHP